MTLIKYGNDDLLVSSIDVVMNKNGEDVIFECPEFYLNERTVRIARSCYKRMNKTAFSETRITCTYARSMLLVLEKNRKKRK